MSPDLVVWIFLLVALLLGAAAGAIWPDAPTIKHIDLVYYPVAAVGVVLLFASTALQRELLEATRTEAAAQEKQSMMRERQPLGIDIVAIGSVAPQVDALQRFVDDAARCKKDSFVCEVGAAYAPIFQRYIDADKKVRDPYQYLRYASWCLAIPNLFEDIAKESTLPEMLRTLPKAYYTKVNGSAELARSDYASSYITPAMEQLAPILSDAMNDRQGMVFVRANYMQQIEAHKVALRAAGPCLPARPDHYRELQQYTAERAEAEKQARAAAAKVGELTANQNDTSIINWIRLSLWPYVLIIALAMKFAKAVSSLRTDRAALETLTRRFGWLSR